MYNHTIRVLVSFLITDHYKKIHVDLYPLNAKTIILKNQVQRGKKHTFTSISSLHAHTFKSYNTYSH